MRITRRKLLSITAGAGTGLIVPGLARASRCSAGVFSAPLIPGASVPLPGTVPANRELPTAPACLICRQPIEKTGGQKLVHTALRGTTVSDQLHFLQRENLRKQILLDAAKGVCFFAWGEDSFMSEGAIERALDDYLRGVQPWFCQKCGKRECYLCGEPNLWLAYGDYAFDDSMIPQSPQC